MNSNKLCKTLLLFESIILSVIFVYQADIYATLWREYFNLLRYYDFEWREYRNSLKPKKKKIRSLIKQKEVKLNNEAKNMLTNIEFKLIEKTLNVILPKHYKEFHLTRQDLISELRNLDDNDSFVLSTNCTAIIELNQLLELPRKTGFLKDKLWISNDGAFSYTFMDLNNENTTLYYIQNNQEEDENLKWTHGGEYDFAHINWEEQMKWSNLEELVDSSIEFILLTRSTEGDFPQNLTIEPKIEGLGLFATENIDANTNLGIGWVKNDIFENGWIRTPIGGFVNHSDLANCSLRLEESGRYVSLITTKDIIISEELTRDFGNETITKE